MGAPLTFNDYLYPPAIAAGFAAVLIGYSSSAVIIFQAASAAGASAAQIGSWMIALGLGMAATTFGLSLYYRTPIITAWSTPGAALLATSLPGIGMSDAIGAFLFSALLITLSGVTGWFARIMDRIPLPLAAAMLAGVLFQFGVDAFVAMESRFGLVLAMFAVYLAAKWWLPRYTILAVLVAGFLLCLALDLLDFTGFAYQPDLPQFVAPTFSVGALIGVGLPLFVVTMASQNIPGIATLRNAGYSVPISPVLGWTGIATLLLAPFGGFALNLAAITAAICAGPEAHPDKSRRYVAGLATAFFYLLLGLGGGAVAALFAIFPQEFVLALAGLALLSTIANALHTAMADARAREAAVITFVVTASGISLFGVGAAFWGLLAGAGASFVFNRRPE